MSDAVLVSVNVGTPEHLGFEGAAAWFDQPWTTAIFKHPVTGSVRVETRGVSGDGQADLTVHGGPDKAICVYSSDHYPTWKRELRLEDFDAGAFGENFTVRGLTERDVCIGDIWSVGEAVVQVSQPRQPCWKLARKWQIKDLTAQTVNNGRTGWYFRVLQDGRVTVGDVLTLTKRTDPMWTISAANEVMHHGRRDATALAGVEALSASWKRSLRSREDS